MRILFILLMIFLSVRVFSQSTDENMEYYDTSDYIPFNYPGALNYNLMIAASNGYSLEVDRLIQQGADVNAEFNKGASPLIFAVSNNHTDVVKLLINSGADVNKTTLKHETPLLIAVKNHNNEIAEALIRAGAEINFTDKYDATPLHYASIYGYFDLVDMLLYYNASIDKKTIEGTTPLMASAWAGFDDVSDLLIQNGANMEAKDNVGFTPFLISALNGDTLLMDLLHKNGVDIYEKNYSNHNALTISISANHDKATTFLLGLGDKWTAPGRDVIDPYDVASKYRRKDIINILRKNNIPGNVKLEIDQVAVTASSLFCLHDLYTGVSLAFKEPYLNAGFLAGCDMKLWYDRVLIKDSEHLFYQYMNKGYVGYAGLFKDFELTDYTFKGNYEISTSLSAGYVFGNQLKGTIVTPGNKLVIVPAISLKWTKRNLSFALGADYMKTEFYHIGPVWLRAGASYNLFFDNVRLKNKILKWY